ncbi:MAG: hypothetical protein QGG17_10125 [Rhodospirillales bacterium]|nr:hypothetical protein [Rhodospirillales bacterium]MDP6805679.1 hypothetical protein [Rhodospirillales bacterium]
MGDCEEFPDVDWWVKHDHQWVIDYVNRRHRGNWTPYIEKWAGQLEAMEKIYERGGAAVIKSRGLSLQEDELAAYVENLRKRLDITQCLARANGVDGIEGLDDFDGIAESSD